MADKYIISGASFNGDGSSPALASSNGGVGAWNTLNVLEGTAPAFGLLAAGDTVYISSKTAAGADVSRVMTASLNWGSTAATLADYITWVVDDGQVWPGVDGAITYSHSSVFNITLRAFNRVVARRRGGLVYRNGSANQSAGTFMLNLFGEAINLVLDWASKTGVGECSAARLNAHAYAENLRVIWGRLGGSPTDLRGLFMQVENNDAKGVLVSPDIQLLNASPGIPIFFGGGGSARGMLTVIGGRIHGPGATSTQPLFRQSGNNGRFRSIGLRFPRTMDVVAPAQVGAIAQPGEIEIIGCDEGFGGHTEREWGFATSRTDSNPPTLNATLPDSAGTPWSWRVYPKAANNRDPMSLVTAKMFTGAPGVKTITQELLVADTMSVNRRTLWLMVSYEDAVTGEIRHVSSQDWAGGAVAASTAPWSAVVWGPVSFGMRKLEVTTPTPVKPDAVITATLFSTVASASANDIYFVNPDFGVV